MPTVPDTPSAGDVAGDVARADNGLDRELVERLAAAHGTPLYIYSAERMRADHGRLVAALGGFAAICYSVKANPNPAIIGVFSKLDCGAEVASASEYLFARRAGVAPERIFFAGPGKGEDELRYVLAQGIGEIHLESREEIDLVDGLATAMGRKAAVSIRVNPLSGVQGGAMRMGGRPSPFGFDEDGLEEIAGEIGRRPGLRLMGLHLFTGTQILDADVLAAQWSHGLDLAERLGAAMRRPVSTVDLGGGLGVPYFDGESALDLNRLAASIRDLAGRRASSRWLRDARIFVEPGRYLVADSGLYVVRVRAVKRSYGTRYVVTDGGMHHHLAAAGLLGQVLKRDFPIAAIAGPERLPVEPGVVTGPLCTPLDTLARRAQLPQLERGDLLAVSKSGAYGLTASPAGFLSHPMPAELLVDGEAVRLIRPRGTIEAPLTASVDAAPGSDREL